MARAAKGRVLKSWVGQVIKGKVEKNSGKPWEGKGRAGQGGEGKGFEEWGRTGKLFEGLRRKGRELKS